MKSVHTKSGGCTVIAVVFTIAETSIDKRRPAGEWIEKQVRPHDGIRLGDAEEKATGSLNRMRGSRMP